MSDQNLSKTELVRRYLRQNPKATTDQIVEDLAEYGISRGDVNNARYRPLANSRPRRRKKASRRAAQGARSRKDVCGQLAGLVVTIPEEGFVIQLRTSQGSLGALYLTPRGLRFLPPRAKLVPTKELSYEVLEAILETPLLTATAE